VPVGRYIEGTPDRFDVRTWLGRYDRPAKSLDQTILEGAGRRRMAVHGSTPGVTGRAPDWFPGSETGVIVITDLAMKEIHFMN
jgi:hypothetical protein